MDSERTLLVVAVGLAFAIGYVLWGPGSFRIKKRKGHVVGLVNLGYTCFLNTLLQALASCPTVLEWLLLLDDKDDASLVSTLRTVLLALNGEVSDISDPYTPNEVIAALRKHHWVISPGEQDAHELFHVLLETLEEETSCLPGKYGSISDILLPEWLGHGDDDTASSTVANHTANDVHMNCDGDLCNSLHGARLRPFRRTVKLKGNMLGSVLPIPQPLPFRGTLTSQLKCTVCGFKSSLRFDKFDTLSLPLPASCVVGRQLTLQMLLDNFVGTEIVKEVTCENCSHGQESPVHTTALKTLNFGKLPRCLCLHIVRTTWNKDGLPHKREDYVDFPEFLAMDDYTHRQSKVKETEKLRELEKIGLFKQPNGDPLIHASQQSDLNSRRPKHLYRLKAVVVHMGDVHSGHFVTYRKGPLKSLVRHRPLNLETQLGSSRGQLESTRWFYTSDTVVQQTTLCQALLSNAYMLFYEKSSLSK